jgi:hypothetical protein
MSTPPSGAAIRDRQELDMSGSLPLRLLDLAALLAYFLFQGLLAREVFLGLSGAGDHVWWILPIATVGGYLWADFISGLVHFLADNFGSIRTPFLGPVVFRTFREHHVDPEAITRHSFLEVNGANCLISVPFAAATYYFVPVATSVLGLAFGAFMLLFLFGIFLTNQFHRWSHLPRRPRWLRALQATGLILSPTVHQRHHTPPYDTYYCITSGLLNPVLARTRLFERIQAPLGRLLEPLIGKAEPVDFGATSDADTDAAA